MFGIPARRKSTRRNSRITRDGTLAPFVKKGYSTAIPDVSLTKEELFYALASKDLVYTMTHGNAKGLDLGNGREDLFFSDLAKWAQDRYGDDRSALAKICIFSGCETGASNEAARALGATSPTGGRAVCGWDEKVWNFDEGPFATEFLNALASGKSVGAAKETAVRALTSAGNTRAANFAREHFVIFGDKSTRLGHQERK